MRTTTQKSTLTGTVDIIGESVHHFPQNMNRIELICLDIDGTLIDSDKNIPEENMKAITWAYREKGVRVAVNSGRIAPSARTFMERLGIHEAFSSLGGCIVQRWDGQVIEQHFIDNGVAGGINALARELDCALFLYIGDDWFLDPGHDFWRASESRATGLEGTLTDTMALLSSRAPNKMLGADMDPDKVSRLQEAIRSRYPDQVDCFKSTDIYLEILPKGINKGTAVDVLCRYYGIKKDAVMSIGDYYNDIDMLLASGLPVAMANSPSEVKESAGYVTEADCDHSGVAEAIRRFIV